MNYNPSPVADLIRDLRFRADAAERADPNVDCADWRGIANTLESMASSLDLWRSHCEAGWDRAEVLAREVIAERERLRIERGEHVGAAKGQRNACDTTAAVVDSPPNMQIPTKE